MQPRNEKFFTFFSKAGSNVVESAAIFMEFVAAPHERWAELAKRLHHTEHAGDDTTGARVWRYEHKPGATWTWLSRLHVVDHSSDTLVRHVRTR
jgi:hypothetical protein